MRKKLLWIVGSVSAGLTLAGLVLAFDAKHNPIIPNLPASPTLTVSTVPINGDLNPYGVAFVPASFPEGGAANYPPTLHGNRRNQPPRHPPTPGTGWFIAHTRIETGKRLAMS